ncbi:pentapeptide repeat-containing protein [Nocardioides sp. MAH-18]|uniref:Pentapeptide repeat-containing protein n=1 Tax=Nocardioides agri TaxID=2682843 RepID=A0A6L6XSR9_9ACTN|nr:MULTISPECIES: pentapeptide repeat-containing protein [unclassified Nocardioides]MBA2954813.1 pentapeptide repeat-containing protein [Nocardioides sp. CGMCC 1.13656]MVQ49667.1 pentapeptide repeat-containing protein [Nocardioides sp. MAH-18]
MVRGPQLDRLHLDGLEDGDPDELRRDADLDGVRYADLAVPLLDLQGARVASSQWAGLSADEADLRGTRLTDVELDGVNVPVVRAARSQWRDVTVSGRLGSVEAYEAQWRSVHVVGCKISYLNLRGAEVADLAFTDCVVEELDLVGAIARRVRLSGTRVGQLNVQHADLQDVDLRGATFEAVDGVLGLRGATVSPDQLALLAPLLAAGLGLDVEP